MPIRAERNVDLSPFVVMGHRTAALVGFIRGTDVLARIPTVTWGIGQICFFTQYSDSREQD